MPDWAIVCMAGIRDGVMVMFRDVVITVRATLPVDAAVEVADGVRSLAGLASRVGRVDVDVIGLGEGELNDKTIWATGRVDHHPYG